jgi:sugar lactone lactonase YvrE
MLITLLFQVLTAPDPAQMEKAGDLGYVPVRHSLNLPNGVSLGAPSSVAVSSAGHIFVFNRGPHPLVEFDRDGTFVRSLGQGRYTRPDGMRIDAEDNIWTTDVNAHTVTKMSPQGEILLVLGGEGGAGDSTRAANARLVNEPTDLAIGPTGDIFVVQGHGRGEPRVLRFDKSGKFIKPQGEIYVADTVNASLHKFVKK